MLLKLITQTPITEGLDFLVEETSKDKPAEFVQENSKRFGLYNGFNMLMADLSDPANAEMH